MFENKIQEYESIRQSYEQQIVGKMNAADLREVNEILFSTHSCAIEGNSFSIDDTRELREKGFAMALGNHTMLEAFELLDHFNAFEYVADNLNHPLDEQLLHDINRLVTTNTLSYRHPEATPGEYTTCDMAAGDTVFGDHEQLIARIPTLLKSTNVALARGIHPMIVAARFHGFFEYLHPFRDGNGRTGRLLSNFILLRANHPLLIIEKQDRPAYIAALRHIRTDATDEHLIALFFDIAIRRMTDALAQKKANTLRLMSISF